MPTVVYDHQIFSLQQFGGISRYFCEIAARIPQVSDLSTRVVAPLHFNEHLSSSSADKTGCFRRVPFRGAGRLYRSFNRLIAPWAMRRQGPSLVHWTYFAPAAPVPGSKTVVTVYDMIHELFGSDFPPSDTTSADKKRCVSAADHVICISDSTKKDLIRLFGIPAEKISVTHLGYSAAFKTSDEESHATVPSSRPYVLYVGHRQGYKGFAAALGAYASSKALRDAFDFVAFGGFPFNDAEVALIRSLGLRDGSVRRLSGGDDALAAAYRSARVFVYPSLYEGFGIPPLEAMACRCPVVCSNTSSMPEVVGRAAELIDPHEPQSILSAMERVCFDEARRSELVTAGLHRAGMYSWDRCARETAAIYREVLAA